MPRDEQKLERVTRATRDDRLKTYPPIYISRDDDNSPQDPVSHGWLRGSIDLRDSRSTTMTLELRLR